jgi:TolB protein
VSKIATSISQLCLFMPGLRLPAIIAIIALVAATSHYSNAYAQSPEVTTLPMTSGLKTPKVSSTPLKAPGKTTGAATTPAEKSLSKSGSSSTGGDKSIATGCRTGGSKISGGRLLFTLVYQNRRQIYGSDLGAQNVFPVITEPGDNYAASISPDGLRFAFISNRTGSPQVFVSAWDGSDIKQLTTSSLKKGYPSWSGDGNTVYFGGESGSSDTNESTTGNVYSVKSSGGPEVQITSFAGRNIAPAVQPDGRTVAYSTNRFWPGWDICLFDMTQKKESCVLAGSHSFIKPRISRDGKQLAFVQTQSTSSQIGVLAVTNRAGGNEYFSSAEHETDPTWGNGDQEIFASSGSTSEEVHRIILKNLKTKQSETIIACSYSLKEPTWSSITQSELDEKRIIGQFKIIQAITPPVGTPQGYTPPYIKPETK